MIPSTLDGWTHEALKQLVVRGVFESDRFDFKEQLPDSRDEGGKLRLRKTAGAFANSGGGFLVFGVKNDNTLGADQRITGIDSSVDFPERFGNFPSQLQPSVEWELKNPPIKLLHGNVVHVVRISPSPRGPHGVLEDGHWWFCKRTAKGTEPMSMEELRAAFASDAERRRHLALLQTELARMERRSWDVIVSIGTMAIADISSVRYRVGLAESLLPLVFDVIAQSDLLVRWLDDLRDAIQNAETYAATAGSLVTPGSWQEKVYWDNVGERTRRIYTAARLAGSALKDLRE